MNNSSNSVQFYNTNAPYDCFSNLTAVHVHDFFVGDEHFKNIQCAETLYQAGKNINHPASRELLGKNTTGSETASASRNIKPDALIGSIHVEDSDYARAFGKSYDDDRSPITQDNLHLYPKKVQLMHSVVTSKATQNIRVMRTLLDIDIETPIVENTAVAKGRHKDKEWGNGEDGKGKNLLGRIWKGVQIDSMKQLYAKGEIDVNFGLGTSASASFRCSSRSNHSRSQIAGKPAVIKRSDLDIARPLTNGLAIDLNSKQEIQKGNPIDLRKYSQYFSHTPPPARERSGTSPPVPPKPPKSTSINNAKPPVPPKPPKSTSINNAKPPVPPRSSISTPPALPETLPPSRPPASVLQRRMAEGCNDTPDTQPPAPLPIPTKVSEGKIKKSMRDIIAAARRRRKPEEKKDLSLPDHNRESSATKSSDTGVQNMREPNTTGMADQGRGSPPQQYKNRPLPPQPHNNRPLPPQPHNNRPPQPHHIRSMIGTDCFKICTDTSIIKLNVDVVVNAANAGLVSGHGVCGAIFNAAGQPELQKECFNLPVVSQHPLRPAEKIRCKTGDTVLTGSHQLKEKTGVKVIAHTVGPDMGRDKKLYTDTSPATYLKKCYVSTINKCIEFNKNQSREEDRVYTIAFPIVGGGIYRNNSAISCAFEALQSQASLLREHGMTVVLCCFENVDKEQGKALMRNVIDAEKVAAPPAATVSRTASPIHKKTEYMFNMRKDAYLEPTNIHSQSDPQVGRRSVDQEDNTYLEPTNIHSQSDPQVGRSIDQEDNTYLEPTNIHSQSDPQVESDTDDALDQLELAPGVPKTPAKRGNLTILYDSDNE